MCVKASVTSKQTFKACTYLFVVRKRKVQQEES